MSPPGRPEETCLPSLLRRLELESYLYPAPWYRHRYCIRFSEGTPITGWCFGTWLLFSISYMGCHPNPIDELIFFKMVIAPPTSIDSVLGREWNMMKPHIYSGPSTGGWLWKGDRIATICWVVMVVVVVVTSFFYPLRLRWWHHQQSSKIDHYLGWMEKNEPTKQSFCSAEPVQGRSSGQSCCLASHPWMCILFILGTSHNIPV